MNILVGDSEGSSKVSGHKHADVIVYRNDFLQSVYEKRMITYVDDFMETSILSSKGKKPLILVTHDESWFGSNDGRGHCWLNKNNWRIRHKGNGKNGMVSAFLCELHGILTLDQRYLKPVSWHFGRFPWVHCFGHHIRWLLEELRPCAAIAEQGYSDFTVLHPIFAGIFMFDSCQNRQAKPPNALSATKMNLTERWYQPTTDEEWVVFQLQQLTCWAENYFGWRCEFQRDSALSSVTRLMGAEYEPQTNSPAALSEGNFQNQREWLTNCCECQIFDYFYPTYRFELNYIEMFWGWGKRKRAADQIIPSTLRIAWSLVGKRDMQNLEMCKENYIATWMPTGSKILPAIP
jgi:hypothetical protein